MVDVDKNLFEDKQKEQHKKKLKFTQICYGILKNTSNFKNKLWNLASLKLELKKFQNFKVFYSQ